MRALQRAILVALLASPALARPADELADSGPGSPPGKSRTSDAIPPPPAAVSGEPNAQPPSPPPAEVPPPAPETPPPPPSKAQGQAPQPQATGQWVYTDQYGWVWMPYGAAYSRAPTDGTGNPYMYVYYPTVGWTWVVAPWLWGWGPVPHFGVYGGWHYRWYGHGWGPAWRGFRPVPYRRGFVFRGSPSAHVRPRHGW